MAYQRRILYVDAYDSFSNNIVGLLEQQLHADVTLVRIDNLKVHRCLEDVLPGFDAVVVGPGPGHPGNAEDVGFISRLWHLSERNIIPVLGICLGFQSLALAFGAEITRLHAPKHGIVSTISHNSNDIFEDVGHFEATQYHSLHAVTGHPPQLSIYEGAVSSSTACPDLEPLAWELTDTINGPVLMALKHITKPFWGVQFHPESICTSTEGHKMIRNWWLLAQKWSMERGRVRQSSPTWIDMALSPELRRNSINKPPTAHDLYATMQFHAPSSNGNILWSSHPLGNMTVVDVFETLRLMDDEVILLDSQGHQSGRYSILGLLCSQKTLKLAYTVHNSSLSLARHAEQPFCHQQIAMNDIWPLLQEILDRNKPSTSAPHDSPFWGGWMGYISYEAGLETLDVRGSMDPVHTAPDLNFVFVERSIVFDHQENLAYIQTLCPQDNLWLLGTGKLIDRLSGSFGGQDSPASSDDGLEALHGLSDRVKSEGEQFKECMAKSHIIKPPEIDYRSRVLKCQEALSAGDSYELCLTDETRVCVPQVQHKSLSPWTLYKRLRQNNPAPFGCYLRFPGATVVGSSPERFLRWTRDGSCQFRPIKGTVKKAPGVDFAAASAILNSSKERAENLMIVDLIRHDLSGVIGAQSCTVPKLMQVEEYKTVYQLVSVIEGQLHKDSTTKHTRRRRSSATRKDSPTGIDILKASSPPGSMTGAPKKRSCEILSELEQRPRGIYSGVIGYMDVGGGGDFSVVIRSAVKWDGDIAMMPPKDRTLGSKTNNTIPHDVWRIGAGGAVTIQSTDIGEFQEMETKLDSVLKTFQI